MIDHGANRLVMVVEDDRAVRESIVEILEDHDYQPMSAANGREAFERLRREVVKPRLILLDMMMPIMDGWEFRALQKDDPELGSIPVVVLTAHADVTEAVSGMRVDGALQKPLHLQTLLTIVERFCRIDGSVRGA
jgi:CheY-like chemotaxis protein